MIKNIYILFLLFVFSLTSCADYKTSQKSSKPEKKYYNSKGFALIIDESFTKKKSIKKKVINNEFFVLHSLLKKNTPVKIINPVNSKTIEAKILNKIEYPKIFNVALSYAVAEELNLDKENPYVEVYEIKKNKKFVAKEGHTFDEEKNVAEKVPVNKIEVSELSNNKSKSKKKTLKKYKYFIVISDFYYLNSANNLKIDLTKKTKSNVFYVEKVGQNTYRLAAGPFKNFNTLKSLYISLNNLGFENLNIFKK